MKKQGFTLIELMVVIVIMGILAAVAVPKLFGMIAKSKASEVGPAAGTYIKLQQAYFAEASKAGDWTLIGYTAPGKDSKTGNFEYKSGFSGAIPTSDLGSFKGGWAAQNLSNLNECDAGINWGIAIKFENNQDVYAAGVNGAGCRALTATFGALSSDPNTNYEVTFGD